MSFCMLNEDLLAGVFLLSLSLPLPSVHGLQCSCPFSFRKLSVNRRMGPWMCARISYGDSVTFIVIAIALAGESENMCTWAESDRLRQAELEAHSNMCVRRRHYHFAFSRKTIEREAKKKVFALVVEIGRNAVEFFVHFDTRLIAGTVRKTLIAHRWCF